MKKYVTLLICLALFGLSLSLGGCAHVDPSITQQSKVYRDAPVEKSKLAVAIKPKTRLYDAPQVLLYPFWVAQKMENHLLVGREITRAFHRKWTELEVFQTIAFDEELTYRGPEQAISVARRAGADLVVVGVIPYLYTGGTLDHTAITLQLRIYETKTGQLLFSMEQAARVNARLPQDWVFFTLNTRLSDSPLGEAIASVASDMAVPLKSWLPPSDEELGFADNAQGISRGLLAEKSIMGSPLAGMGGDADGRGLGNLNDGSVKLKVEFDVDSFRIRPESYGILNELAKALKAEGLRGRRVLVSGHTDSDYTLEYNQKLSENRAASVKKYLVERGGIPAELLRTEGFGKTRPLVPNSSPANKQRNRRVEVRLDEAPR